LSDCSITFELFNQQYYETHGQQIRKVIELQNEFQLSLVDMEIWHWMYNHPESSPTELKYAMIQIAKDIWNTYFTPVFKKKDVVLLAIYSHIIHSFLYIPDYAIGHMISSQIEGHIKKSGNIGAEVERMVKAGSITPNLWMKNAVGKPVGSEELLNSTKLALEKLKK